MLIPTTGATEGEGTAIGATIAAMTEGPHEAMTVAAGDMGVAMTVHPTRSVATAAAAEAAATNVAMTGAIRSMSGLLIPLPAGGYGYASLYFVQNPAQSVNLIVYVTCTIAI